MIDLKEIIPDPEAQYLKLEKNLYEALEDSKELTEENMSLRAMIDELQDRIKDLEEKLKDETNQRISLTIRENIKLSKSLQTIRERNPDPIVAVSVEKITTRKSKRNKISLSSEIGNSEDEEDADTSIFKR